MREILFRAKAINRDEGNRRTNYKNGDWVYGLITRLYDERFENLPAEMTDINGVSGIEVDYKTIGQYTGYTDKNGKKIFEGDICENEFADIVVCATDKKEFDGYVIGSIYDKPNHYNRGVEKNEKRKPARNIRYSIYPYK